MTGYESPARENQLATRDELATCASRRRGGAVTSQERATCRRGSIAHLDMNVARNGNNNGGIIATTTGPTAMTTAPDAPVRAELGYQREIPAGTEVDIRCRRG